MTGDGKVGSAIDRLEPALYEGWDLYLSACDSFENAVNSSWYDYYVPATDYGWEKVWEHMQPPYDVDQDPESQWVLP